MQEDRASHGDQRDRPQHLVLTETGPIGTDDLSLHETPPWAKGMQLSKNGGINKERLGLSHQGVQVKKGVFTQYARLNRLGETNRNGCYE